MTNLKVELHHSHGETVQVCFERDAGPLGNRGDASLALSLLPSMFADAPLRLSQPVSSRLLEREGDLQDVLRRFFNWRRLSRGEYYGRFPAAEAREVKVKGTARQTHARAAGVGCFFTGGLDSFYSVITHKAEITHLVYVLGYDLPYEESRLSREVLARLSSVAESMGKELVVLKTDLRSQSDRLVHWHMYHGSALACAAFLLSQEIGKIYVPSTYTYEYLVPLGSHPSLDPLWSTDELEFVHHGCGADRPEKALVVGRYPEALRHLRVCWENRGQLYNCGLCEKCKRTLVEFDVAGFGGLLESIPGKVSWDEVGRMPVDILTVKFWRASLEMALRRKVESFKIQALRERLQDSPSKRWRFRAQHLLSMLQRLIRRLRA